MCNPGQSGPDLALPREFWEGVVLSPCLSVGWSVGVSVCRSVCLSVCLSLERLAL